MSGMIKPEVLKKGDQIGFISPSSGLSKYVEHRLMKAKDFFEESGYNVKLFPTTQMDNGFSSSTVERRVNEINSAFNDNDIKALISTIGGNTAHQLLPYLDYESIAKNPTIFCGFSDTTSLNIGFYTKANLMSFYGPSVLTQFGEFPVPNSYTVKYFMKALSSPSPIGHIKPSDKWTDDKSANWLEKEDLRHSRKYRKNEGYKWLSKGKAKGTILGGCLPTLIHLRGTEYWPEWEDKILLIETPEGRNFDQGISLERFIGHMIDLKLSGVFDKINGMIVGRGFGYTQKERKKLANIISDILKKYSFPILYNIDIGHTDPIITLPLGAKVIINSYKNLFKVLESGVN